jgi:hypothetical protein
VNEITIYLFIFALWIVYAIIEGYREAYYYYAMVNTKVVNPKNLHPIFALQRGLIIGSVALFSPDLWNGLLMALILSLIFPFFHDGMYYQTRNELDSRTYPKGWWDFSMTSNAVLEIKTTGRIVMAVLGLSLMGYFIYRLIQQAQ